MSTAISVKHLTKIYKLYDKPIDRLKESLHPLKKSYHRDFYALNDVSFEIKRGETVGIIGKNGAGKSTLLKIITGVLTPTSGSVHVHGRIASLLELGAGFNPEYTGIENIYFQGSLMGYTREEMESKIDEILAFADIGDFVHQSVKMYSSGMFARLAFAVAINVDPDVLIVDEALSVGDSMFQHKCTARMRELIEFGTTILFVSHSIDSVRALCDKAIWIQDGSIKMIGDATELTNMFMNDVFIDHNRIIFESMKEKDRVLDETIENFIAQQDNGDLKILSDGRVLSFNHIVLLNSQGSRTAHINQGEAFTIEASLTAHQPIKNLSISFLIKDRFAMEMTGESIFNKLRRSIDCKAGETMTVHFSSKCILRGGESYTIALRANSVSKWDRSDNIALYNDEHALLFDVLYDHEHPMWFKFQQDFALEIL
jgi:ABC-type polysaccharide/polyol phosphate transport system ATPase subunit